MQKYYSKDATALKHQPVAVRIIAVSATVSVIALLIATMLFFFYQLPFVLYSNKLSAIISILFAFVSAIAVIGLGMTFLAAILHAVAKTFGVYRVENQVRLALFAPENGNPLHLRDGERLPTIECVGYGRLEKYELSVSATSSTVEEIANAASAISSSLKGKQRHLAVVGIDVDPASAKVTFLIEDVASDRSIVVESAEQLRPSSPNTLLIQQGTNLDLRTAGSILVAGKTRSGKTTGVISLLLQVLMLGRDNYGSEVIICDPKRAELSRLPHTYTLDEDGEARVIIKALENFVESITLRQKVLNDLSEEQGDAVKWWNADMHPSFLFIDEFVALRSILPKKVSKEEPSYCLDTFDKLLKRIVTTGASAGCFVIISIAEASVEEGGLPAMLRSAMTTKTLFKPTTQEGRLMWDSEKINALPERNYSAGDAWFSSTDGENDHVSSVHFPILNFPVYAALRELLVRYYQ